MSGEVGMSWHEKEGNKKWPTPRQKVIHNPIVGTCWAYVQLELLLCVFKA